MSVTVLHVFVPNYKTRFGGPIFDWKFAFSHWNDPRVIHKVLDYDKHLVKDASDAFDFEISNDQALTTRKERTEWIFFLLRDLIRHKHEYDILHFHVLWWGGLFACTWAKWNRIPTIYQSVLLGSDTPKGVINQRQGRFKEKLLKNFSAILAISDALAEEYLEYGFPGEKVFTLMNSVDMDVFHPVISQGAKNALRKKFNLPQDATILIFAGSLIERKGVDILLQAFVEATKQKKNLYLLLVGPRSNRENPSIDEEFIEGLEKRIRFNELQDKVNFTGLVGDRERLADFYRSADIFVFPSRNEGLGNVVLEAMATGLPVLTSDLSVFRSVITNMKNGILVPIEDSIALARSIELTRDDTDLAQKLGSNAREYIVENHQFAHWENHLSSIYHSILSKSENE